MQEVLSTIDMAADFTDTLIAAFKDSGKHVSQACGAMVGIEAQAIPAMQQCRTRQDHAIWGIASSDDFSVIAAAAVLNSWLPDTRFVDVSKIQDGNITGVIGMASWQTYLAAARGLAVVEILPRERPLTWLSKWKNPWYRAARDNGDVRRQIETAIANLEQIVCSQVPRAAAML